MTKHVEENEGGWRMTDKFEVAIGGSKECFECIEELIDHVQCNVCFEVDSEALRSDLKYLRKGATDFLHIKDMTGICILIYLRLN
ncbi:hypothetical protein A374_08829 [Fictibacillus macauensis ZFHKF-1]|uniref:Uncharacterized protein n=1 Tax=Fictibacillus macauensis ZFHKF-1 TaxID=1196324 RepID=I8AJG1_9BACL|nr:hypothetical protein [Fictibacillus macauensis]EIT85927.1 hypothetical protein A374_08829 [Fictibacillus macauensis ZFHKF-1]